MRISVYIKPNSKKGPLVEQNDDNTLTVYTRQPAVDGKANDALIKILATHYKVPKTTISIVRGQTARVKTIDILD